mgnify:CR=1 FL=1
MRRCPPGSQKPTSVPSFSQLRIVWRLIPTSSAAPEMVRISPFLRLGWRRRGERLGAGRVGRGNGSGAETGCNGGRSRRARIMDRMAWMHSASVSCVQKSEQRRRGDMPPILPSVTVTVQLFSVPEVEFPSWQSFGRKQRPGHVPPVCPRLSSDAGKPQASFRLALATTYRSRLPHNRDIIVNLHSRP